MADFSGVSLSWLGNDRVKISATSGSTSIGMFSSNVRSESSQGVLNMDRSRFEHESEKIRKTGGLSLEMQIKKDAYYRKIDDNLFQYNQKIHDQVEKLIEKASYIFRTGVQGIRVGDKRNPPTTIGVSQPQGNKYLNFLLLFLDNNFYAVAGDEIFKFGYSEISNAEYSFGFTKKRISFVYEGDKCHVWVYSAAKDDVKSAVNLMESSRTSRDYSSTRSKGDSGRKSESNESSTVCPSCKSKIAWNENKRLGECSSCGKYYEYKQGKWISKE